jgi:hypothetical protein
MKFLSSVLLFLTPLALALPVSEASVDATLEARACDVKCGSTCYTNAQVSTARTAGYKYYSQGSEAGSSTYPHTYNNYEGFDFPVNGPYQEFPLKTSGAYTGGKMIDNLLVKEIGLITNSRLSRCGQGYLQHCRTACR